jgi:putative FmdB family regulatory protein
MPVYNFNCNACSKGYEEYTRSYDPTEAYPEVKCPKCGSTDKKKTPSLPAPAIFAQKEGTSKMDNFVYRAGANLDRAQGERRAAEAASHMGQTPYNSIDDISSGNYFGEVE